MTTIIEVFKTRLLNATDLNNQDLVDFMVLMATARNSGFYTPELKQRFEALDIDTAIVRAQQAGRSNHGVQINLALSMLKKSPSIQISESVYF